MRPAPGTNLDTSTDSRKDGIGLVVCRALVMVIGVLGIVAASRADDGLAGLADPTRPSYVSATTGGGKLQPTGPLLQSTFISTSQRRAVIGGKSYRVGDKFDGAVITEIQPYEVVLKKAGRETHLRLLPKLAKETYVVKVPANSQEGGQK
ncbi:MAG: hypothetical protein WB402_07870 [Sulfuricaulis sp.]|uniref:hypothetical protein n=1 Tax=Sulfuricaulis sp. TaxID=2003553 RepID=UPI003C462C14